MHVFLTSNPMSVDELSIREDNDLVVRLKRVLPENMKAVFVTSDPANHEGMMRFAESMRSCFENSGFTISKSCLLDGENEGDAEELISEADLILFLGGHVPTQNAFLQKVHMRELLQKSHAVLIGFSAGTMNLADVVYAMPELEGEALDPDFQRFIPGLGYTKTMVIPHYDDLKDTILDGQNMITEIAFEDSMGREFIAIPDGSYIEIEDGVETIRGRYYRIQDGKIVG